MNQLLAYLSLIDNVGFRINRKYKIIKFTFISKHLLLRAITSNEKISNLPGLVVFWIVTNIFPKERVSVMHIEQKPAD